jgi:hypothetical protein
MPSSIEHIMAAAKKPEAILMAQLGISKGLAV